MDNENKEQREFVALSLYNARAKANRSQEYMALEMGIARKTVQNWERGISVPSVEQSIEWFNILGISPLPYLFQYVHPEMRNICSEDELSHLRASLKKLVDVIPEEGVRQLLYLMYGNHGSSPRAVLNMVTAHLQTDMKDRVIAGSVILKNYEMAQKRNRLKATNHVQPDVAFLRTSIENGEKAVVNEFDSYFKSGSANNDEY